MKLVTIRSGMLKSASWMFELLSHTTNCEGRVQNRQIERSCSGRVGYCTFSTHSSRALPSEATFHKADQARDFTPSSGSLILRHSQEKAGSNEKKEIAFCYISTMSFKTVLRVLKAGRNYLASDISNWDYHPSYTLAIQDSIWTG